MPWATGLKFYYVLKIAGVQSLLSEVLSLTVMRLQSLAQRLQGPRLHLCKGVVTKPTHPQL